MLRVPFTIANNSISFYAKGRMHSVTQADPASYAGLRAALQTPTDQPHDIDTLMGFVDVRQALVNQSKGRIVFIGEDIVFNGEVQHGLWVDKIMQFRAAGEPFEPIWNALDRLLHNPTPQAITRLPIFLERTGLGFLPDGRFIAFKGVQSDFCSAHASPDGTRFRHQIGDKPRMLRELVDANPNQTCSTGLHVGAPGYVRQHYSGGTYALVLVAVDPVDVVCVPTDYDGEKMRVCGYEVIDHLDQDYSDELLGRLKTTVTGYSAAPMPVSGSVASFEDFVDDEEEDEGDWTDHLKIDDVVRLADDTYGVVVNVNGDDLQVRDAEGDVTSVSEEFYAGAVLPDEQTAVMVACIGALIRIEGDPMLRDGDYTITGFDRDNGNGQDEDTDSYFQVGDTFTPVQNDSIKVVSFKGEHLWPRVATITSGFTTANTLTDAEEADLDQGLAEQAAGNLPALAAEIGDLVVVSIGGWPPAGTYPVIGVTEGSDYRLTVATEHDGIQGVPNQLVSEVVSRPAFRAQIGDFAYVTGHAFVTNGWVEVTDHALQNPVPQIQVRTIHGPWWIDAALVTAVKPNA